jgi:hypothetical protein
MEFNPANNIVKLCLRGMSMEDGSKPAEALFFFMQAWNEAANDFEKFLGAHYLARQQKNVADKLQWYETALQHALQVNDDGVKSAFPALYTNIAKCHEDLGDLTNAQTNHDLAASFMVTPSDSGPFYHGTRADLQTGDLLIPGHNSNYKDDLRMDHIYFTALPNAAGLAAALAKGESRERVYIVVPTVDFENDPNVTDKKFPGNPTRSYRTGAPLTIIGELTDWARMPEAELQKFRERLAGNTGEIIN